MLPFNQATSFGCWTIEKRFVGGEEDLVCLYIGPSEDAPMDFNWTGKHVRSLSAVLQDHVSRESSAFIIDFRLADAERGGLFRESLNLVLRGSFSVGYRRRWALLVCRAGSGIPEILLEVKKRMILPTLSVYIVLDDGKICEEESEEIEPGVKMSLLVFRDYLEIPRWKPRREPFNGGIVSKRVEGDLGCLDDLPNFQKIPQSNKR